MSNLSQQFVFTIGTGTSAVPSVSIGALDVSPNGDYLFISDKLKGDGYYNGSDGFHTVTYTVSSNFVGTLAMQASLATSPVEGDWFNISNSTVVHNNINGIPATTTTNCVNFTGNFVWVRATVNKPLNPPFYGSLMFVNYNH
jgi:hypothetical protein